MRTYTVCYIVRRLIYIYNIIISYTVERRLSERQSSESSIIRTSHDVADSAIFPFFFFFFFFKCLYNYYINHKRDNTLEHVKKQMSSLNQTKITSFYS